MVEFLIIIIVILIVLLIIIVVYPALAKKYSPDLKSQKTGISHKGITTETVWQEKLIIVADATNSISTQETNPQFHIAKTLEEENKQLENENAKLKKLLLGTSTVAAITSADAIGEDRKKYFEIIRDATYQDVNSMEPTSDIVDITTEFIGTSYKGSFLWITKDGKEEGPYCIPCSTKGEFNKLIEIAEGHWKDHWRCSKCNRMYDEEDSSE